MIRAFRFSCLAIALAGLLGLGLLAGPAQANEPAEGKGHAGSSASPYLIVDPIPISIIRNAAGRGILVVEIGLDTGSLDEKAKVEHALPLLRDLYIQVLNLYASRDLHLHHPPNAMQIKSRLQEATDDIIGKGKAKVLLRQILVRRL